MACTSTSKEKRMKSLTRLVGAAVMAITVAALASPAEAAVVQRGDALFHGFGGAQHAVFVQTDNTAGNQIVAYHRATNGTLSQAGIYPTGGLGGQLSGSVVDHLASQGSLSYDPEHALLYAVNAGSDTVSVFAVAGDQLSLRQIIGSGGQFPVSIAVRGDLVYVVNAENGGSVQGYYVFGDHLVPIPGSNRALGLDPTATPQFTNTPGQVAFSPDGSQLIVTTKANGNDIDVFGVTADGSLTASPVVNSEPGTVPFAIAFDPAGHLVIAEAGPSALETFTLQGNGEVTPVSTVPDGQAALCWVTLARGLLFASNAGSASISGYSEGPGGQLSLLGATGTDPGTVDSSASPSGRYLYVQTGGNGIVDEYTVSGTGTLTEIGSVTVPGAVGGEGIVAR
jgi:6-phosphogluconolactonase (cycloisomerase 2 family)